MSAKSIFSSLQGWKILSSNRSKIILKTLNKIKKTDVYRQPELYDLVYPGYSGDLDYYSNKSKKGKILYLGVGTGRIFCKIFKKNNKIIGIDNSKYMMERLINKYPEMKENLKIENVLTAHFPENTFDLIIAPYSFFQCFEYYDLKILLKRVLPWLKKRGLLISDTFSPFLIPFSASGLEANFLRSNPRASIFIEYDHLLQKMRELTLIETRKSKELIEMNMWYHFPGEILKLAKEAGFKVKVFGDYGKIKFTPKDHEVAVFECMK